MMAEMTSCWMQAEKQQHCRGHEWIICPGFSVL